MLLNQKERDHLKELAKLSVKSVFDDSIQPELNLESDILKENCGAFVTLTIDGNLRGCIGNLTSNESLVSGIRRNTINAAFHDPRFSSLSLSELDLVSIEISILSEPRPLHYRDAADLLKKIHPHIDGVILRKGIASATFLPQVWEQLPQPQDFLKQLCLKAGLAADAWQHSKLEVSTYQVQHFEEHHKKH